MNFDFMQALWKVKLSIMDAANKSNKRHLQINKENVTCKPGCSFCCSRLIHITIAEAIVMLDNLRTTKKWETVKSDCVNIYKISMQSEPLTWFKMNIQCPVLDKNTNSCNAYQVRPTPCSTHWVCSPPDLCDPWGNNAGTFRLISDTDIHQEFFNKLEQEVDGHGILILRLPIPAALLFAERIQERRNTSIEEAMSLIRNELK